MTSRNRVITLKVNDTEHEGYNGLAKKRSKPLAELIRYLLDRECDIENQRLQSQIDADLKALSKTGTFNPKRE